MEQFIVYALNIYVSILSAGTIQENHCGGLFNGTVGNITSPNYPFSYRPNTFCTWTILAPPDVRIDFELSAFDIRTRPGYPCQDFLQVEGAIFPSYRRCGFNFFNQTFSSQSKQVKITFYSDATVEGSGFMLKWRMDPNQYIRFQKSVSDLQKVLMTTETLLDRGTSNPYRATLHISRNSLLGTDKFEEKLLSISNNTGTEVTDEIYMKQSTCMINEKRRDRKQGFEMEITIVALLIAVFSSISIVIFWCKRKTRTQSIETTEDKYMYHDPESFALERLPPMLMDGGNEQNRHSAHASDSSDASYLEPMRSNWPTIFK